jgi:hypothetical protein
MGKKKMSQMSILQQSHRDFFLEEGFLFALQFNQGWVVFRVMGKEDSQLRPWNLGGGSGCPALGNLSAWDEIQDSQNRHYLEPAKYGQIKHIFWGVSPPKARIYLQYPTRVDRNSLLPITRTLTDDVGYVNGEDFIGSPYDGPFSSKTELFTVREWWPAFQAYNPTEYTMNYVLMNFDVRTYTYNIVTDQAFIKDCLTGVRRCRKYTVGGIDIPMNIPAWLQNDLPTSYLAYTQSVMTAAGA